jgi:hypothetical protein
MVSLSLITQSHRPWISWSVCCLSWITLLHLSTQIRYADSERIICSRRDGPWWVLFLFCWSFSLSDCRFIQPQPRIIPRLISGHGMLQCGHRPCARGHTIWLAHVLYCVRMCVIDSVALHVMHFSLSLYPGMLVQYFPIMWVSCIALYRNCWISSLIILLRPQRA